MKSEVVQKKPKTGLVPEKQESSSAPPKRKLSSQSDVGDENREVVNINCTEGNMDNAKEYKKRKKPEDCLRSLDSAASDTLIVSEASEPSSITATKSTLRTVNKAGLCQNVGEVKLTCLSIKNVR